MIVGPKFDTGALFRQTQKAGEGLSTGTSSSSKTEQETGKEKTDEAGKKLAGGMKGSEKTQETGKQQETKKKEGTKEKSATDTLGSEAFMPTEEEEQQDPEMDKMEQLKQQAKDFKLKGSFQDSKRSGSTGKSGRSQGTRGSSSAFFQKIKKSGEGDKKPTSTKKEESEIELQTHSDDGMLQEHTGLSKKGEKKEEETTTRTEFKEEAQRKKEIVTRKDQQDSDQGGPSQKDQEKIEKLEKTHKIRRSTPLQDAAEASKDLEKFQKDTGMSTKALKQSNEIAKTIIDEPDPAKKTKQTRMKHIKGTKGIIGNEKSAEMRDISVKPEPVAILPVGVNTGETELVTTKLPEKEPENKLVHMETPPVSTGSVEDNKGIEEEKDINLKHLGSKDISLQYTAPQSATEKGKAAFESKYGVKLEGNTRIYHSSAGTTIVDQLKSGDGKVSKVPAGNLFDGHDHKVVTITPEGSTICTSRPDKKDANHIFLTGTGGAQGSEWHGDGYKTIVDGKETYKTVIYPKPTAEGAGQINSLTTVSGNREDTKIDVFKMEPENTAAGDKKAEEKPVSIYHLGTRNASLEYKPPQNVTKKGKAAFEANYGAKLEGNAKIYQSSAGTTIVDQLKPGDDKASKVPEGNLFDGGEHKVYSMTPQGGASYISTPDKNDQNHVTIAGTGVPGGNEWYGDVYKSNVDGKETYKTVIYGKEEQEGGPKMQTNMITTVSGNKEDIKIDAFKIEPQNIEQTGDGSPAGTGKSCDFASSGEISRPAKLSRFEQIRGTVKDEVDRSTAVCIKSRSQDQVGDAQIGSEKKIYIDGVDPEEASKKSQGELLFDGKSHVMVTNENTASQQGQFLANTVLKVIPDKDDPNRVTFTGRYEHSGMNGKALNVQGEAIRTIDKEGKENIEYKYTLIDPQTRQPVFSGNGDQLSTGDGKVSQRGKLYEGGLPEGLRLQTNSGVAEEKDSPKSAGDGYNTASFLKRKSSLEDFNDDTDVKSKKDADKDAQDTATKNFKEEGSGFSFGSKDVKQGVMGNEHGFMVDGKFIPGQSAFKSDDGNLIIDNRVVDTDTGKLGPTGKNGIWIGPKFFEDGSIGKWEDGKFVEAGKK